MYKILTEELPHYFCNVKYETIFFQILYHLPYQVPFAS